MLCVVKGNIAVMGTGKEKKRQKYRSSAAVSKIDMDNSYGLIFWGAVEQYQAKIFIPFYKIMIDL